jgi:hypothetical protein
MTYPRGGEGKANDSRSAKSLFSTTCTHSKTHHTQP